MYLCVCIVWGSWFFSSTLWLPRIKLRASGLPLPTESSFCNRFLRPIIFVCLSMWRTSVLRCARELRTVRDSALLSWLELGLVSMAVRPLTTELFAILGFWDGLTEFGTHQIGKTNWPAGFWDHPLPASTAVGLEVHISMSSLLRGSCGSNSGAYFRKTDTSISLTPKPGFH